MVKEFVCIPYNRMGEFVFGMSRHTMKTFMGEPVSTETYGYPVSDRFLDDYGFLYMLYSNQNFLEAIEIYPEYTEDMIVLVYGDMRLEIKPDAEQTMSNLKQIADDFVWEEDTYSSEKLGMKIFCPDEHIENILIYDSHYFD